MVSLKKKIFVFVFFSPLFCLVVWDELSISAIPSIGPSLQKPFQEYLEAQRIKLHHKSDSAVPQVRASLPPRLTLPFPAYLRLGFFTNVTPHSVFQRSALTQGIDKNLILKATWELKILIVCRWIKIL